MNSEPDVALGVPAYFVPGQEWAATSAGAPTVRYLIANPSSGPGLAPDPAYVAAVSASRAAGVEVLGYLSTCWGSRPFGEVVQEMDAYWQWYGISSVFLDEAASGALHLPYYRRLALAARARAGAQVAVNPGTVPDEAYAALADVVVLFEGTFSTYEVWRPPSWQERYPRERVWHLVHSTPPGRLQAALLAADRRAAGVVYVTDDVMDNPWDRLPSYWQQELQLVRALCR